jgi:hypothetical protein
MNLIKLNDSGSAYITIDYLPEELMKINENTFDIMWNLHPTEKHKVLNTVLSSVNEKYRKRTDAETNIRTGIAGYALTGSPGSTVAEGALVGSEVFETIAHSKVLEDPDHKGHLEKFHKDYNEAKNNKDKALQMMTSNTYMFYCIKTNPYIM